MIAAILKWILPDRSRDTAYLWFCVGYLHKRLVEAIKARFVEGSDVRDQAIDMLDDAMLILTEQHIGEEQ